MIFFGIRLNSLMASQSRRFVLAVLAILPLTLSASLLTPISSLGADKLIVYSGRSERLIKPVLDAFTAKTGIQIELLSSGTTELVNRLKAEGDRTLALVTLELLEDGPRHVPGRILAGRGQALPR